MNSTTFYVSILPKPVHRRWMDFKFRYLKQFGHLLWMMLLFVVYAMSYNMERGLMIDELGPLMVEDPVMIPREADSNELDPEALIDGSMGKLIPVSNWGEIYGPLRVFCYVLAKYDEEKLMVIQETWGQYCDKLFFVVDERPDENILKNEAKDSLLEIIVPIKTNNHLELKKKGGFDLWKKCWSILEYLEDHHHGEYDHVLRADDDTWFGVNNFKSYAQYFDPKLSWYFGHTELHQYPRASFQAGGNYALSMGAVERLVDVFRSEQFQDPNAKQACRKGHHGWAEDVWMSFCLRDLDVHPLNTLNEFYQLRWSPWDWEYTKGLRWTNWWYWKHRFEIYPVGDECCDLDMISLDKVVSHKDPEMAATKLREEFLKYDMLFESGKIKEIPVPPKPRTFLFSTNTNTTKPLRNKDLIYRHE